MGSNDWDKPQDIIEPLEKAISNSLARGRNPFVIVPNKSNKKIKEAAEVVEYVAKKTRVPTVLITSWSRDKIHPSVKEYKRLAKEFEGALIRGDSFAVGIITYQKERNPKNWSKVGAKSKTVLNAISRLDNGLEEYSVQAWIEKPKKSFLESILEFLKGIVN